jgi:hypothetical protein
MGPKDVRRPWLESEDEGTWDIDVKQRDSLAHGK